MATEVLRVVLPLKIVSVANMREHWASKAARAKKHRKDTRAALSVAGVPVPTSMPLTITLTRISARQLDSDNLASAFKACRDGVADWLARDDNHPSLTWLYAQRKGQAHQCAAEISIALRGDA